MSNTLEELKTALQNELIKEPLNFERISDFHDRLLALDPQATRFTIDAQHIHRLGFELVGKQETALSELIKNAYDADATYINLDFKDYNKPGGTLIISDDGNGMTVQNIRDNWMHLSTSDKEQNPVSPLYGRSRAGRKGIGRFAVERLGRQLLLETKRETKTIRVHFDWETQYQSGKLLTQIMNPIEQFSAEQNAHGTTLRIGKLRDKWTKTDFIQIWKYVLLLQPPFEKSLRHRAAKNDVETYAPDPGFKVRINGELRNEAVPELSIEKSFLANRTALIKGWIDAEGNGHFQVHSEVLGFEDSKDSEDKYQEIGPLEFEVSYFVYDSKLMPKLSVRQTRKMGKKFGGIRVYRDGFRVLPYGESSNDWLQLAIGERNRLLQAKHENFFGHVALTSAENPAFEETASREGLVENEAYKKLCDFINECLEWAVLRVVSYRHRQLESEPVNSTLKPQLSASVALQAPIDELKNQPKGSSVDAHQIACQLEKVQAIVSEKEQKDIQYSEMLRVLASLGISIAVFSHETRGAVTRLKASLTNLQSLTLSACQNSTEINEHFGEIKQTTNDLDDLAGYISAQIDHSVTRNKDNLALYAIIQTFIKQFQNYLNVWKIAFEWDVIPNYLRTTLMHRNEIDAVLFNFLTNAIKAMARSDVEQRRIKVTATKQDNFAIIRFQDTGAGVADDIKDRIFDAFFTTSSQNRQDEIAGPGCGLGLKIVSDIAKVNKGFVRLSEPDSGYSCCFEFGVPISSKQLKLPEV
jgi:signal transduction histidine kinase